ncbi:carboxylesterase/lipase family protein [Actinophytocola sp.]|uniref:carboxylesterase/lipase family protein n=1 Tax=Actinophytocola sp. TaxID=1872138 RepID=UPI003899CD06
MTEVSVEPEVRSAAGAVRGRREGGLAVFRGIPFAAPPVGAARFGAPRPAPRWDGVREAFSFGPAAPQGSSGFRLAGGAAPGRPETREDWLTLNVWTPAPDPAARRPVMVWIHGGAYKLGSSAQPGYDARRIARDGELVVVTCNYRLGVEGFAAIAGAPANRALLDQVAALEWVRDNITAFGGDPDRVTVFGESAGAGSVAALLVMPAAAGLFRRAVAQSVPGTFVSAELAADVTAAIAAQRGLRPTIAELSTVEPRELAEAGDAVGAASRRYADRWGQLADGDTCFAPVVDGEVLPTTPWRALAGGAARAVELVVGHNREEFRLFMGMAGKFGTVSDAAATRSLRLFAPGPDGEQAYRTAFPAASAEELYERVRSDWLFRMPSLHLAESHVAGGGRAHLYELTWPAPGAGGRFGACHGLDIPLLFGTLDADLGPLLIGPEPSAEAQRLSAAFRTAWTAFATTGDPGWPAFDGETRLTRIFDAEPAVMPYPEETSRLLWRHHEFAPLPLLG